ncbi:pyridoxal phosphate-dependent aminotransferase [Streptomyces sp. NRRL F-5135]|uniref:pyridoxal phosphate-dependent aminotransferase n=1 Tax=Streptomyces sp. NRRL F-5135 TaxID=1463858 RepID=UPI000689E50E|nr:pyridoxal phosphate-dependent aminotransferase [Streptomyces sp. NRRL F-5135]
MQKENRFNNLTRYEHVGINQAINLADGHAHQGQNSTQRTIVADLPNIFEAAENALQATTEREFQRAFYTLAGQYSAVDHPRTMLCYSASLATDLVATFLASQNLRVGLLQPCFDNLATILRRRQVKVVPLGEEQFRPDSLDRTFAESDNDAVFLTLPNNPTGFHLNQEQFRQVIDLCAEHRKILIVDCTFRFFAPTPFWDQYAQLEESGISYVVVEDTGKTWPTQDLKCSILAVSADLHESVLELHNDILLNVSPFILQLLTAYLRDTERNGLQQTIWSVVRANRTSLRKALEGTVLVPAQPESTISVEWVRIDHPSLRSDDLVDMLAKSQVGILPGDHFYWDDHETGSHFIRFALAREERWFATACRSLREALLARPELIEGAGS